MAASLAQRLGALPTKQRHAIIATLTDDEAAALLRDWRFRARPEQLISDDDAWFVMLLLCGRSWGKSDTGAHWLRDRALSHPGEYLILAPRFADTRRVCVEGPSGLIKALEEAGYTKTKGERPTPGTYIYNRAEYIIWLDNGSRIHMMGADISTGGVRGLNLSGAWVDEVAAIRVKVWEELWGEHLLPALRIGDPRVLMTTTPKPIPWLRDWVAGRANVDGLRVIRGRSEENVAVPRAVFRRMRASMSVRQARQELDAEILDDIDGALWTYGGIDEHRVTSAADVTPARGLTLSDGTEVRLDRIVVAVDPPASTTGDECGIVVVGLSGPATTGHCYVLADRSAGGLTPEQRTRRAVEAYRDWSADSIIIETNNGGDWLPQALQATARMMAADDPSLRTVPVKQVRATRGKAIRAEPIAALYEQGRVHHVGAHQLLEDQMTSWVPGESQHSPDRIDALVWAVTHLTQRSDRGGHQA